MSKLVWQRIKLSKRFYVRTYRKLGGVLLSSVIVNLLLGFAIIYVKSKMPEPDYYSTYGEVPPVKLTALDGPNYSSQALLPDDRQYDDNQKQIPN